MTSEVRFTTGLAPGTPAAGKVTIYAKSADKKLYIKDDAGAESLFALGGVVGPANAVYLTTTGVDGSAVRGDASKPFGTLKAALAACQSGDALYIGPGLFSIAVAGDVPAWPAGCDQLVIVGSGCDLTGTGGTRIVNSVNDGSHIFNPPNTADYIEIRNLYANVSAGAGRALFCDGTGGGGSFLGGSGAGGLVLRDCILTGAVNSMLLQFVGMCMMQNVVTFGLAGATSSSIQTSNVIKASGCFFSNVSMGWDEASGSKPTLGSLGQTYQATRFDLLTFSGQAEVTFESCDADGLVGSGLSASGARAPQLAFNNGQLSTVDFFSAGAEYPDTLNTKRLDLAGTRINTSCRVKIAGAAANRLEVNMRNTLLSIVADTTEAGNGIDLNLRGATMALDGTNLQTSGTGTGTPSAIFITHNTDGVTPDTVPFPFTAGVAPSNAQATGTSVATAPLAVSALAVADVTLVYTNAVAAVHLHVMWL